MLKAGVSEPSAISYQYIGDYILKKHDQDYISNNSNGNSIVNTWTNIWRKMDFNMLLDM